MTLPSDWSPSNAVASTLAERLMAWRPDLKRRVEVSAIVGSDRRDLVIQVSSPSRDTEREISIRITGNDVQLLFGPCLVLRRETLEGDASELWLALEGIVTDRIVLSKRTGMRAHPWEVIDTQGKDFMDRVSDKYRWGRFEVKSWSGESDADLRMNM